MLVLIEEMKEGPPKKKIAISAKQHVIWQKQKDGVWGVRSYSRRGNNQRLSWGTLSVDAPPQAPGDFANCCTTSQQTEYMETKSTEPSGDREEEVGLKA